MPQQAYDTIIYGVLTAPYARFIHYATGRIWDVTNSVLSATPTYNQTDVALTYDGTYIGGTPVKIPAALPAGEYHMLIYDNAAPVIADAVVVGKHIGVINSVAETNARLTGLPIDL